MGTLAHVIVVGGHAHALDGAQRRIADLERRWSRFLPDSEVSRMNARRAGDPARVTKDTLLLVQRAVRSWQLTDGLYDPTVLPAMRSLGYDTDFATLRQLADDVREVETCPTPGCAHIEIDEIAGSVSLPPGVELDPGGIGKGLAADVVTAELLDAGAHGALVNIGGDLRARGEPPETETWSIDVVDPARKTSGCCVSQSRTERSQPRRATAGDGRAADTSAITSSIPVRASRAGPTSSR